MKIAYLIFVTVMIWNCTIAQNNDDPIEKENAMLIAPIVSVQIPGADLANRFGVAYLMGLSLYQALIVEFLLIVHNIAHFF